MYSEKRYFSCTKLYTWTNEPAHMNSSFPKIASHSLPSAPTSRPVSQDTLGKWQWAARDKSYMCNQASGLGHCLTKVQESMVTQLKVIQGDRSKGISSNKLHQAAEELDYLITFNRIISQAMAWTMQDLEGVFINVANLRLALKNSYLEFIKAGIKQDTLTALRTALLHINAF